MCSPHCGLFVAVESVLNAPAKVVDAEQRVNLLVVGGGV